MCVCECVCDRERSKHNIKQTFANIEIKKKVFLGWDQKRTVYNVFRKQAEKTPNRRCACIRRGCTCALIGVRQAPQVCLATADATDDPTAQKDAACVIFSFFFIFGGFNQCRRRPARLCMCRLCGECTYIFEFLFLTFICHHLFFSYSFVVVVVVVGRAFAFLAFGHTKVRLTRSAALCLSSFNACCITAA